MSSQGAKAVIATGLAASLSALVISASAASLGGITTADLFGWGAPVIVPVPVVVGFDHFACTGNLAGQTDDYGNVWVEDNGAWRCVGSSEVDSRQPRPLAHATVDLGVSDQVYLTAYISAVNTQANKTGPGVALFSNGAFHMFVVYQRDLGLITLGKFDGTRSTLTSTAIPDRATAVIRVEIEQPDIRVQVDGVTVINHTMSATETLFFGSNTRFGLEADNDNQSRFDWFQAEAL